MKTSLLMLVVICAFSSAFSVRESFGEVLDNPAEWSGSPGKGADVLFIFLGYDDYVPDTIYACGDSYWNPAFEESGSGWSLNTISASWTHPSGMPYHWNGGLGSAMTSLGYSWEWFPGCTGRCGQVIPDAATLAGYNCVFILTFDAYRSAALTSSTRSILDTYILNGGHVVLISQDARFSGVPEEWLDTWFETGAIQQDIISGTGPVPANGLVTSFMIGWFGTALMGNFSTGAGGYSEGNWWMDNLSGNGCIGNGTWVFSSYSNVYGCIFSTFDFETCNSGEVESITEIIMDWITSSSLERETWGAVKARFQESPSDL